MNKQQDLLQALSEEGKAKRRQAEIDKQERRKRYNIALNLYRMGMQEVRTRLAQWAEDNDDDTSIHYFVRWSELEIEFHADDLFNVLQRAEQELKDHNELKGIKNS